MEHRGKGAGGLYSKTPLITRVAHTHRKTIMPPDLADLTRDLDRQAASVHTPEDGLAAARATVKAVETARQYRTLPVFEAKMLESHGYTADAKAWWQKVKRLDDDVHADLLRLATAVPELRRERFRRFWSAAKVQRAVLEFLYAACVGGVPRISRSYVRETAFIV